MQYGVQANEEGIRSIIKSMAVFGSVTTSQTSQYASGKVAALSSRIAANLMPQPGHQTVQDIQTDFANAQIHIKDVQSRQTQSQTALQSMV
ncbi:UNVERIFIED_CONTAM: hypothetical protein NY603_21545, partial [Bacteroidetes bacterium 56_B9]